MGFWTEGFEIRVYRAGILTINDRTLRELRVDSVFESRVQDRQCERAIRDGGLAAAAFHIATWLRVMEETIHSLGLSRTSRILGLG